MSFTQIEKNIIKALGECSPTGITTLMPLIPGLESKTQLSNVLNDLKNKGVVKQHNNCQWAILKTTYKQMLDNGDLENAVTSKPAEPLEDLPGTKEIRAPKTALKKRAPASKPTTTDMVRELMSSLPAGASLGITAEGITLFWNQVTLEPSTEELDDVMQSINCLQKHVA